LHRGKEGPFPPPTDRRFDPPPFSQQKIVSAFLPSIFSAAGGGSSFPFFPAPFVSPFDGYASGDTVFPCWRVSVSGRVCSLPLDGKDPHVPLAPPSFLVAPEAPVPRHACAFSLFPPFSKKYLLCSGKVPPSLLPESCRPQVSPLLCGTCSHLFTGFSFRTPRV